MLFGSQGMGLFGSLEAQLGILVCLCGVVIEKELRRIGASSSCDAAISLWVTSGASVIRRPVGRIRTTKRRSTSASPPMH